MHRERLEAFLKAHHLEAVIATSPENIQYATGYVPFQGVWNRFPKAAVAAIGTSRPTLVLPMAEVGFAADDPASASCDVAVFGASNFLISEEVRFNDRERWICSVLGQSAYPGIADGILATLKTTVGSGGHIAVDQTGAPELLELLRARGPAYEFLPRGEDVWRLVRMVKMPDEILRLDRAIAVNEIGIAAVHLHLGRATEVELASIFAHAVHGAGGTAQHWLGSSGRLAGGYRKPQPVIAGRGSRWRFDAGVVVDGYCSDLGGTAQIGAEPSPAERKTYEAITAGVDEGVARAKPGVRPSELYQHVLAAVRRSGLPDYRYSLVGHGIGVEPRDYPILAAPMKATSPFWEAPFDPPLEAGMVLNIEVPIIELGVGGFQHEVTFVVQESGGLLLSRRRDYVVVELPS
jgi:Xaa-Pro aminopeptidase